MLTDAEAGYLAGIIDGEGSIHIRYKKPDLSYPVGDRRRWGAWACRITVNNTNADLIEWLQEKFPAHRVAYAIKNPKHKPLHEWRILGKKAAPVLEAALPYLVIKRRQAEIALEFISTMGTTGRRGHESPVHARRLELEAEITELNRRGMRLPEAA